MLHIHAQYGVETAAVPPMARTAAVGAIVHLLATAIEEGRDLSSMSGILADRS